MPSKYGLYNITLVRAILFTDLKFVCPDEIDNDSCHIAVTLILKASHILRICYKRRTVR